MSINDLVKEEAQRQIDLAIEGIPSDRSRLSTPIVGIVILPSIETPLSTSIAWIGPLGLIDIS